MREPKVSIVTATYNSESYIEETYDSIKSQSYANWEWLVTDDCSSDSTVDLLKRIAATDERIKVFQLSVNSGAAVARNNSLENSTGEYIAFIDSDDIWEPSKLEMQLSFMLDNNISFSFTAYELVDKNGRSLKTSVDTHLTSSVSYEDMLKKKATLGCSTVMLKRSGFKNIRMPLLRTGQDYATWLSLLKTGQKAVPLTKTLTKYRILPDSISRNKFKKAKRQWQIYREVEMLAFFKSLVCFSFYAWRAVFRK